MSSRRRIAGPPLALVVRREGKTMRSGLSRPGRVLTTMATVGMLASTATATTLSTRRIRPGSATTVVCTALNLKGTAIGITAQIIDHAGTNVTDLVATQWIDETAGILASVRSESRNPDASYCRVDVTGGRRSDVSVLLELFDADGNRVGFVTPR